MVRRLDRVSLLALALLCAAGCSNRRDAPAAPDVPAHLAGLLQSQQARVEAFFGSKFPSSYVVRVFDSRAALQAFTAEKWKMPELPCWAVALGTGSTLAILDPQVWKEQACEHDGSDAEHVRGIVAHELVHVFHGQHSPDSEFERSDDAGWFVEGLAVYASGQLTEARRAQAAQAARGGHPKRLADAWTGNAKYAVAGSLVEFVDRRVGRAALPKLLTATTTAEVLGVLKCSEEELLQSWRGGLN